MGYSGNATKIGDPLTARQQYILDELLAYIRKHQFPPTVRELGELTGITSPNGMVTQLKAIERKGYIKLGRGGDHPARAIVIVNPDQCPYYGHQHEETAIDGIPDRLHGEAQEDTPTGRKNVADGRGPKRRDA